jgi:multidrug efflux pump subunit AcrA (membrane-fusion protein)
MPMERNTMRASRILTVLTAGLLAAVACNPGPKKVETAAAVETQGLQVAVLDVTAGDVESRLSLSGTIAPTEQVMAFAKVAGRLTQNLVKEGQTVAQGQVVATVNRDEPGQEFKDYQVTAPLAGVVAKVSMDPGSMVAPSVPLVIIINTDAVKLTVSVIESEIGKVRDGLPVQVVVPAWPDRRFSGHISNVLPIVDPMSRTAKVEVKVPNSGRALKPGMSATAELILGRHTGVVTVPRAAIIEKMGERYVFLYEDGKAKRANIQTGYDDGQRVEVTSGIRVGDKLIASDLNVLKDGSKVRAKP